MNGRDFYGQRITAPHMDDDAAYCRRHRRIVSASEGCEMCEHEAMAEDEDDARRECAREAAE